MSENVPVPSLLIICVLEVVKQLWTSEPIRRRIVDLPKVDNVWAMIVGEAMVEYLETLEEYPITDTVQTALLRCSEGLALEIFAFCKELSPRRVPSANETRFCLKHTMIKQTGCVDKRGSFILLLTNGFPLTFDTVPLAAKYWVNIEQIRNLTQCSQEIIAMLLNHIIPSGAPNFSEWYMRFALAFNDACSFWPDAMPVKLFQFTIWANCAHEAREYYLLDIEPSQRQSELAITLKVLLCEKSLNASGIEFIVERMDADHLADVMLSHRFGQQLFKCLFNSWRNRHICLQIYVKLVQITCPENLGDVLCCAVRCMNGLKERNLLGNYMDAKNLFVNLWHHSPIEVKSSEAVTDNGKHCFILMICELEDLELLSSVLSSNFNSNRTRIDLCITAILTMTQDDDGPLQPLIEECLQTISHSHSNTCEGKLLTYNYIANYLIRMSESGDLSLLLYFPESLINITTLKQGLMNEKQFLINILKRSYGNVALDYVSAEVLLKWALGNENISLEQFRRYKLLTRGWYPMIYVMLMMDLKFTEASRMLMIPPLNVHHRIRAKNRLRGNMVLLHKILRCLMAKQIEGLEPFDKVILFLHGLFDNEMDKNQFMDEFLLSDEALEMFFGVIGYIKYVEGLLHLKLHAFKIYQLFMRLKRFWIQPYVSPVTLEARIREYGHPNTREAMPTLFSACCLHTQIFDNNVEKIIEANYMCFRAVLLNDFSDLAVKAVIDSANGVSELTDYFTNALELVDH